MTLNADRPSSKTMLLGVALIWFVAQVATTLVHRSWGSCGDRISRCERCCSEASARRVINRLEGYPRRIYRKPQLSAAIWTKRRIASYLQCSRDSQAT
jgi:hypothetical protein